MVVATKKYFSNRELLSSVREYLPAEAVAREIDAGGKTGNRVLHRELSDNTFYQFDAETVSAIGSAIEDLALEEADGSLLACFQDFNTFEAHRERYGHLAMTIDRVEVLGGGKVPPRIPSLRFIPDRGGCNKFWAVLYQGRQSPALLICQQANQAKLFEEKTFVGFYTFDPALIGRMRQGLLDLARGRSPALAEFARQQTIDRAVKEVKREFVREREALSQAVGRLQVDDERYQVGQFKSDLEKGLLRLHHWKTRMPQINARAEGRARP